MAMTMTQKTLAAHAGLDEVRPGQLITAKVDMVLGNDITSPVAINEFQKSGFKRVFDPEKVALVMDHFVPNKDIKAAGCAKQCRAFAGEQCISHFYDAGRMGIEHALLPEQGVVKAGDLVIGADSHTCTYGALGAFSTGVGSTDMAAAMATGELWFKVPSAIRFVLHGKMQKYVSGKDVILHILRMIGVDGARYRSMEFTGDGIANLTMDDRFTIANMAIEGGAKNGIFPVDDAAKKYMDGRISEAYTVYAADEDAQYDESYDIALDEIQPTVASPHLPENGKNPGEWGDIPIDQVVIGSCTNGRLSDMAQAAEILAGHTIAPNLRCIVIPATQSIYKECLRLGYIETFIDAGCVVSTPTCGPCLGGYMGILAEGERCVSTTNRNFVGRMGHKSSEVYLASPSVAAATAIEGKLAAPKGGENA